SEGEEVTVSLTVTNIGEEEGTYTVNLKIDGLVAELAEVTLKGGASTTVSFTLTEAEGTYQVEVDGLTDGFTVTAPGFVLSPGYIAGILILIIAVAAIIYAYWKGMLPPLYPKIDDEI
ncbi:unnamed protein product, partial [marine sediment metagenome]